MHYGVIGDAHHGFKAYDSNKRTEETIWTFVQAIEILYTLGVKEFFLPGDLLDDTVITNWVEKKLVNIFSKYQDATFYVLGGNHDCTKTYASVSALDVLAELSNLEVINNFEPIKFTSIQGLRVVAIPHMKSQREFKDAVMAITGEHDIAMLHAMVCSNLDLGPNDLNIDEVMLYHLEKHCNRVFVGHQHNPVIASDKTVLIGSTMEFGFGELGPKYVYHVTDKLEIIQIPQPRSLERIDINWSGIGDLLDRLSALCISCIYKVVISNVPSSEYSACLSAIDSVCSGFSGDLIYDVIKLGHEDVEISTIDASFDLKSEFTLFCEANAYNYEELIGDLEDAISALMAEEEDLSL